MGALRPPRSPLKSAREWDRWAREQDVADQAGVDAVQATVDSVAADLSTLDARELTRTKGDLALHFFLSD